MILIGSQALNYYVQLDRKLHDWDFVTTEQGLANFNKDFGQYLVKETNYSLIYDVNGELVEIRNPKFLDETDKELLNVDLSAWVNVKQTKFGAVIVPTLECLYDIKKSTALCINEPKHRYDLNLLEQKFPFLKKNETEFFKKRLEETRTRTKVANRNMYEFFHKYHIPEYIEHDRIHQMFADLLGLNMPTYARLTVGPTEISEDLFNKLTHDQKVSLMAEESLVLAMERWFIPQMIENGINHRLIDHFYNNNEAMPTYKILKHVNITGLKGEAQYVVDFGRNYFFEIEQKWCHYKEVIKSQGGLPRWFLSEIFDLRKRYRNGEKIGTV